MANISVMTPAQAVQVSISDRIATITLASPPANALGVPLKSGLSDALDVADAANARVLVVRSEVDGYFAAGADLKLLVGLDAGGFLEYLADLRSVLERIAESPSISIAAVDGYALGGGLELAMACTIRVASARAKLGVPEIKLGLLPGAGGTQRLPRLIGRGPALDLLLSGRSIGAEEGLRLGLVDHLAPDGAVDGLAVELAGRYAAGPSAALAATVRCVDAARDRPFADGMVVERDEIIALFETEDAREGISAFVEKRQAAFR